MSRIIVKNLPDKITKEKLLQLFSEKGTVTDIQLKFTKDGKFRKFAFVGYKSPEQAEDAIKTFDKTFIYTSRIQVEVCAGLGDENKPRPWSKYAPENSVRKKRKNEDENLDESSKEKNLEKKKIKDPKVIELIQNYGNEVEFSDFLEASAPKFAAEINQLSDKSKSPEKTKKDDSENENIASKNISDLEYLKLKTGKNVNIKSQSEEVTKKSEKKKKVDKLYTIKLSGLPLKVKKSQIKNFLSPLKPFTIRRALKIKGVAYCGFKTEKEMRVAFVKNKTFLGEKRIFITAVKSKDANGDSNVNEKWKKEVSSTEGLESIAESGRIFVRNLPYTATEEELRTLFEKYGPVSEFNLPVDFFTRKIKGFATVTFLFSEHAWEAFTKLDGTIFQGRMLHLLPARPPKTEDAADLETGDSFKTKKLKKEKLTSGNWNTFFIGENALAETMAASYNTTKEAILDDKEGRAAVRLALGETQFVNKMKEFLEDNNVSLEAFENMSNCSRSKTVILVKNLPVGTKAEEIREKFSKFGELKRVVLPPSGAAALVEFIEPSEAKIAFKKTAYSKFKHVPLYLEWAPEKIFTSEEKSDKKLSNNEVKENNETGKVEPSEQDEQNAINLNRTSQEGCVIFVKNLNFATEDEALKKHFSSCGEVLSATIARRKNSAQPDKKLSMGYGFVVFSQKESASKALKALQFSNLDNHKIELKRSDRTTVSENVIERNVSKSNNAPSSKILVKNVPFQAKQKEIFELFKVFGEIKGVRLPKKMTGTGLHRGFCFVEYNTVEDAKRAFNALSQSTHLYGRRLVLEWAAGDEDVATLRDKTAQQFKSDTKKNKKSKAIEEDLQNEDKINF